MSEETADNLPDVHLSDVQQPLEPVKGMSIWARMRLSYIDMREATRSLIEESPSEPRLLFFVLMSDVVFFLSFGVRLIVSPSHMVSELLPIPAALGVTLVGVLLLRTMIMYVFAALCRMGGLLVGGRGSFKELRTGVFWGSLVAAPIGVLGAIVGAGFANLEDRYPIFAEPIFAWPPLLIGVVAFVYFLSAGVAEAHRFRSTSPSFIFFSLLSIALLLAILYGISRLGFAV